MIGSTKLGKFGTYGFLAALLATQMAAFPSIASDKTDRAVLDTKKSARSMKRDVKKTGRKLTGQENSWDDTKDSAGDAVNNAKDEVNYHEKKLEKKH